MLQSKEYCLRLSATHKYTIHAHADILTLCSHTATQKHTWCSVVQGLSDKPVWYPVSSLTDKILKVVPLHPHMICCHQSVFVDLETSPWRYSHLCVFPTDAGISTGYFVPHRAPRTCKHSRYYLPLTTCHAHETRWFASQTVGHFVMLITVNKLQYYIMCLFCYISLPAGDLCFAWNVQRSCIFPGPRACMFGVCF